MAEFWLEGQKPPVRKFSSSKWLTLMTWYWLCLIPHAAVVTADISSLGVILASVSGVSAAGPIFGGGRVLPAQGGPSAHIGRVGAKGNSFKRTCANCDSHVLYEGWQMPRGLVFWQVVADLVITATLLSVPVQLYMLLKKAKSPPYGLLLAQLAAFAGLCGLSHFINLCSFNGLPQTLALAQTACKVLSALVALTSAVTLFHNLPDVATVHMREVDLRIKTLETDKEVLSALRTEDTSVCIRRIILAIRSTLDRDAIGSTAVVELRDLLGLENVALWLPTPPGNALQLCYESCQRMQPMLSLIPTEETSLQQVVANGAACVISDATPLAKATTLTLHSQSRQGGVESALAAAVSLPLLNAEDTEQRAQAGLATSQSVSFGVLVAVWPPKAGKQWRGDLLEALESVADQVAIALSHAAILEDAQRVRETLATQADTLRLAEFEGKSAVRARNDFLTVMKHEIRTPMHSITGLSTLLAEADLEEEQRMMVKTVARSSALLFRLVSDILDFWRLEGYSLALSQGVFELPVMIKEAETLVSPIAKDKGLTLVFKMEEGLPNKVTGDANRMQQIILNAVGNAIKYTPKGGTVTLTVSMEKMESARAGFVLKAEAGHVFVRFECKDSGVDLAEKDVPRLFEKFQDGEGKGGSRIGLGMALSKEFVELHEGHMWIESGGAGKGAICRFIVRLKLEEEGGEEEEEEDEWEVPVVNFFALKIMVVDDNMVNRVVTKKLLTSIGSQTKVVESGKECLRLLSNLTEENEKFDVLLLDLMMPEMDGYTCAKKILEEIPEKYRPIIVALTANAGETTKEKCLEHGMVGMITKPISLNLLRELLGKMLDSNAKKDAE